MTMAEEVGGAIYRLVWGGRNGGGGNKANPEWKKDKGSEERDATGSRQDRKKKREDIISKYYDIVFL